MATKVDMSLDDIISKSRLASRGQRGRGRGAGRGAPRGVGRGASRGAGRGATRGVARGSGRGGPLRGRGQRPGRGGARAGLGFRSPRGGGGGGGGGNINGRWSHDMYYGGASAVRTVSSGPTKLNITNLDFGVSDSDIKELFSEFGVMKIASVHYDRTGRSLGTAHVIFERRADAMKAIKQYNGVHLDGRPMHIDIDGVSGGGAGGVGQGQRGRGRGIVAGRRGGVGRGRIDRGGVKRLQGGPRPIGGGPVGGGPRGGRGRGGVRGRTGRGGRGGRGGRRGGGRGGAPKKIPTAEELDAELEEYTFQATSK